MCCCGPIRDVPTSRMGTSATALRQTHTHLKWLAQHAPRCPWRRAAAPATCWALVPLRSVGLTRACCSSFPLRILHYQQATHQPQDYRSASDCSPFVLPTPEYFLMGPWEQKGAACAAQRRVWHKCHENALQCLLTLLCRNPCCTTMKAVLRSSRRAAAACARGEVCSYKPHLD